MRKFFRSGCTLLGAWALLSMAVFAQEGDDSTATPGQLLISEFRLIGPNGQSDEFIEIYNTSNKSHTVVASDNSAGYAVAASDGVIRFTIPNGTTIPGHGHFLGVNSNGYSLGSYATGDTAYTNNIPDDAGIALFNTTNSSNFNLAHRLDAVGPSSEANTLYREGTGYPPLTPFLIEGSFFRKQCDYVVGTGCTVAGNPKDTDNNAADFMFADTDGTDAGAGQHLGAPGPENLSSPIRRDPAIAGPRLDSLQPATGAPNRVRDLTSNPANNSTLGTISIRLRIQNNTGANVTRLRFRIIELPTFPAPTGVSDVRAITSSSISVSGITDPATCLASTGSAATPCTVTVLGMTLEQAPTQPNGGGYNSTLAVGAITTSTPLAPGASVNVQFLLGVEKGGSFHFLVTAEALP